MSQQNWALAYQYFGRSTKVFIDRARQGALRQSLAGTAESETVQHGSVFAGLIHAAHRLATQDNARLPELTTAAFTSAQWSLGSEAAGSLAQMAARNAKGDNDLARLVRERQDLVTEWQGKDQLLTTARGKPPAQRDASAEEVLRTRLAAIDARRVEIDTTLSNRFPDYVALTNPEPLGIADVQSQLNDDEVLVLFLDTPRTNMTPEGTFIWVVTKTDSRWVRSELGTNALSERVGILRCGLDSSNWIRPGSALPLICPARAP